VLELTALRLLKWQAGRPTERAHYVTNFLHKKSVTHHHKINIPEEEDEEEEGT
jgi:hypothetical protein